MSESKSLSTLVRNWVIALAIVGGLSATVVWPGVKGCTNYFKKETIRNTEVVETGFHKQGYEDSPLDLRYSTTDYKDLPHVHVLDDLDRKVCIYGKGLKGIEKGTKLRSISYEPKERDGCHYLKGLELMAEGKTK